MSTRPSTPHGRRAGTLVLTAAAIVLTGGVTGGVAAADPPGLDPESCSSTLARAAAWPGPMDDGYRLVSDSYDGYLSRQPACTPGPNVRSE